MSRLEFGTGVAISLAAGQRLRIEVLEGHQVGDLSFSGFDQALTRDVNGFTRFNRPVLPYRATPGMALVDGDGAPTLEVGEASDPQSNDIMLPGCRRALYSDGRAGCRELIAEALGIRPADLTGMLSFFMVGAAAEDYYDGLAGTTAQPGSYCTFLALKAVTVGVSACPGTGIPGFAAGALDVHVD